MAAGLLVDKPPGITSHDVVARVRRERGEKAGHAGTLDPFATGLLIVLLGRATRLQRYLLTLPKTYVATARLGWRSTTGDPDGELTETGRIPQSLELPTGEVEQRVPMTSAVKVGGERLYKKARRGEEIETPTRAVTVHGAALLESDSETATFEIECSTGTYVRTLIETLGDAYCASLRRTAIGPFTVPDHGDHEIDLLALTSFMAERELSAEEAERVSHGRGVDRGRVAGTADRPQPIRLIHGEEIFAIAREEDDGLKPEVVLR